jgi:hypothetical protein
MTAHAELCDMQGRLIRDPETLCPGFLRWETGIIRCSNRIHDGEVAREAYGRAVRETYDRANELWPTPIGWTTDLVAADGYDWLLGQTWHWRGNVDGRRPWGEVVENGSAYEWHCIAACGFALYIRMEYWQADWEKVLERLIEEHEFGAHDIAYRRLVG